MTIASFDARNTKGRPSALVGDVGGTNARFAIADHLDDVEPRIRDAATVASKDYPSLQAAMAAYLKLTKLKERPAIASIAVAGPVIDGAVQLTNLGWQTSEADICDAGFRHAKLVNDFGVLAMVASVLGPNDLHEIGPSISAPPDGNLAIIGAGTGLGVSALVRSNGMKMAVISEGGHVGFAPEDDIEAEILQHLTQRFGHVSVERILSGPGLLDLYSALCSITHRPVEASEPAIVVEKARQGEPACREAVERFCAIMGTFAGDVALMLGSRGGLFIAGGIAPRILSFLEGGAFRRRFEAKGRLAAYLKAIPTKVITRSDAALLGAACVAADLQRSKTKK